jgi:hypothetical protein
MQSHVIRNFLHALLGDEVEDGHFLIWTAPDKKSYWSQSPEDAAKQVEALDPNKHVYFGIGLSPENFGPNKRCPADKIQSLVCIGLDLDVAHETKQDKPYFGSKQEAWEFLKSSLHYDHFLPTITIDSGHGLIPLWVFNEPWDLDTNEERNRAHHNLRCLVYTMRYYASKRGRDIDATQDLARVWRLPGTWNCKDEDNPVQAQIYKTTDNLFNPGDIELFLKEPPHGDPTLATQEEIENYSNLVIDPTREKPNDLINTLAENDELFQDTWNKRRRDFKGGDQSLSVYDMALANIGVKHGLADQDIADIIIEFRKKHAKSQSDIEKAYRVSYLSRTIFKAKQAVGFDNASEELDAAYVQLEQSKKNEEIPKPDKDRVLEKLELVLRCPIKKIIKYPGSPKATYDMILDDDRRIFLGDIDNLKSNNKVQSAIADATQTLCAIYPKKDWAKYVQLMLQLVTEEDTGLDSTLEGQIFKMLHEYLEDAQMAEKPMYAAIHNQPFEKKGETYIFVESFHEWLGNYKISRSELTNTLSRLGAAHARHTFIKSVDDNGFEHKTSRSTYNVTKILNTSYDQAKQNILQLKGAKMQKEREAGHGEQSQGADAAEQ